MKIVIDANLFAGALMKPFSNPGRILDLIRENEVELVLSPPIIRELKRTLLYPKIQKYHGKTRGEIDTFFEDLLMFAWIVEGETKVDVIQDDPSDNKYLACAREGEANFIISGDHHLLQLKSFQGIKIIKPKKFFDFWDKHDSSKGIYS